MLVTETSSTMSRVCKITYQNMPHDQLGHGHSGHIGKRLEIDVAIVRPTRYGPSVHPFLSFLSESVEIEKDSLGEPLGFSFLLFDFLCDLIGLIFTDTLAFQY